MTDMLGAVRDLQLERLERSPEQAVDPAAFDNFQKVAAIRPDDKVLLLIDKTLDPRVVRFLWEYARGRGASVQAIMAERAGSATFPEEAKPLIESATILLTTWFSTSVDPYFLGLRKNLGQRYVKLTYFRSLDLMQSESAKFPVELISLLIRKTAEKFPRDSDVTVDITDPRGSHLNVTMDSGVVDRLLSQSRWRGAMSADHPGAYVHWIPTHGPNFWDFSTVDEDFKNINGVLVPAMSVGFAEVFDVPPKITIENNVVTNVDAHSAAALDLAEMVQGGKIIEIGCGFNPKHPRYQIYPAGSNSAGAIHIGLNLVKDADKIDMLMPDWPEPPEHIDLVFLDMTVTVNGQVALKDGRLAAIDDKEVRQAASRYGSPSYLLEQWPDL